MRAACGFLRPHPRPQEAPACAVASSSTVLIYAASGQNLTSEFAGSLLTRASGFRLSCWVLFLVRTLCGSDDADAGNRFLLKTEPSREAQRSRKKLRRSKWTRRNTQLKLHSGVKYRFKKYMCVLERKTLKTPPGGHL